MKKAHWFIVFLLFAISCLDEPDCFRLNNNIVGIGFRKMFDGKADTVKFYGMQALAAPDVVFNYDEYLSEIYVPLDFFTQQTDFTLETLFGQHHLSFGYDVKTQFVSEDCGARYVLTGLSLLQHDYDSVNLVSTIPTSSAVGAHLLIYRCPRMDLMKLSFRQLQEETSIALTPKIEGILPSGYSGAIYTDTTLNAVNLPLNPNETSVRFDFAFQDYEDHFVVVNYESSDWTYREKYCPTQRVYHDLAVGSKSETTFDFDSVIVTKDSLQDPPVTNIVAYRCPDTNLMRISFRSTSSRAATLGVTGITNDKGELVHKADTLQLFTLPLTGGEDSGTGELVTQTTFTFNLDDGTQKTLTIGYTQGSEQSVFNACGVETTFTDLSILATDFTSGPTTPDYLPTLDYTTFPVSTNFEITK